MAIKQMLLAEEGPEDPRIGRRARLQEQIKQARELLKKASEVDSKSERVFNLKQRIATLQSQLDRLGKRIDDTKDVEKKSDENKDKREEAALKCAICGCQVDSKGVCHSTSCTDSPDYNALTQI